MSEDNGDIDDIIDALKEKNSEIKKEVRKSANKDNLEEYVIESASTVINEGLDLIKNLGVFLNAAPDAKDLSAYSELLQATSTAIESLNKIIIQNKKGETLKELKKMDYEQRRDLLGDAKEALISTREEIFKKMIKNVEIIDISAQTTDNILSGSADNSVK